MKPSETPLWGAPRGATTARTATSIGTRSADSPEVTATVHPPLLRAGGELLEAVAAELRDRPNFTDADLAAAVQHGTRHHPRAGVTGVSSDKASLRQSGGSFDLGDIVAAHEAVDSGKAMATWLSGSPSARGSDVCVLPSP
jgi:hypothetical protein